MTSTPGYLLFTGTIFLTCKVDIVKVPAAHAIVLE